MISCCCYVEYEKRKFQNNCLSWILCLLFLRFSYIVISFWNHVPDKTISKIKLCTHLFHYLYLWNTRSLEQTWKRVFFDVWAREKDHRINILILKAIPDEVWNCGPSARVLDLSHNSVEDVPAKIGFLSSIQVARCFITFLVQSSYLKKFALEILT